MQQIYFFSGTLGYARNENDLIYLLIREITYNIFQPDLSVCAYEQTWCEKVYISYVYQKQNNLLEHQCEKTNSTPSVYFKVYNNLMFGKVSFSFIMKGFICLEF